MSNLILKEAFLSGCSHISFLLAQACLSCWSRTSSIQQKFFVRERAGCFLCGVSRDVHAGAACLLARGLPLRPGRALPFLKRKEAKIRQRGEFRFSPPWNPHSTTKGAAFGNRERLPLWFLPTHRHSLHVKQVRKGSFNVCKWYGKCFQANKRMRRSRIPKTASQRERSENARRQTGLLDLFSDETRRVGIFIGALLQ